MLAKLFKQASVRWRMMTRNSRVLPDFLTIGAQRSGTSTLYQYLIRHPCIGPAARKEVSFFDQHFRLGLDWYRAQFPTQHERNSKLAKQPAFLTGEASPSYLLHPSVPERVAAVLPGVQLIAILRDPVERSYSNYHRSLRKGLESRSFAEAVQSQLQDPLRDWHMAIREPDYESGRWQIRQYLMRGLYAVQLEHWLKFFRRDQLLTISAEEFFKQPRITLNRVCQSLKIPTWSEESFRNSAQEPTRGWLARKYSYTNAPMDESLRCRLKDFFRPHNQRLYELLGQDYGWDA